ncbi:SpoIIE family protein phosphatase [Aquipuribacter hungaricus]|uniref:SpoIIE family protein phosphatase n=1 Tax=Aquipuribacter hungaricus TaxID=545624 RepID=A0ABV7WH05_9MICO
MPAPSTTPDDRSRAERVIEAMSVGYLTLDAAWRVTQVNAEAVSLLGRPGGELVGGVLWDLFPDAVGSDFETAYRRAVATGRTETFDAFYPAPLDAWYEVRAIPEAGGLALYFLDVTARRDAERTARHRGERLAAVGEVALALADAQDMTDLVTTMAERGLGALGADGGAVAVPDPDDPGALLSYITSSYGPGAQASFGRLTVDAALPVCEAYTTGRRVLVPDLEAALAYSPLMADVVASTGSPVYVSLPLRAAGQVIGVLTAGWEQPQPFDDEQLELVETYAAQCAQALQRLRARDLEQAATAAARRSAEQQAALVALAMTLEGTATAADVLEVVGSRAVALLGAQDAVLCLAGPTAVRALTTTETDGRPLTQESRLPADLALPMVDTAVTGTPHHFGDRAEVLARFPAVAGTYAATRTRASAAVPLRAGGTVTGSLAVAFDHDRAWVPAERDLLDAVAALTGQALERISARDAERTATRAVAQLAETLQRSLLSSPPQPHQLEVVVRYAPAASEAEVGGDWYDAFVTSEGTASLVVGDVTGHDRHAAAAMAQLRNLLRGIGYAVGQPPAAVLSTLDRALGDLSVDAMATVVLVQAQQSAEQEQRGAHGLHWANAGHLPPLLVAPDGTPGYLLTEPELMLGVDPSGSRTDHHVVLEPGATLLLFTDGLVERRGAHLQAGLDWLARAVGELVHLPLDELCDAVLGQVGSRVEDDVVVLAVRPVPPG